MAEPRGFGNVISKHAQERQQSEKSAELLRQLGHDPDR